MNHSRLHRTLARLSLLAWCVLASWLPVEAAEMDSAMVRAAVENIAKTNDYFSLRCVVHNGDVHLQIRPFGEDMRQLKAKAEALPGALRSVSTNRAALIPLLEHPDPKVRTLALGALFVREDRRDLPLIASLLDDEAPTFPDLHSPAASNSVPLSDHVSPQTVHDVAKAMLEFAGAPSRSMAAFKEHWQKQENQANSARWFKFKLERANRRTSPIQREYLADIQRVIAEMEALPLPDRGWIRLYVLSARQDIADKTVTDDYLVEAAKELGPDALLRFLRGEKVTEDPDIRLASQNNYNGGSMARLILLNADRLLRADQYDALLESRRSVAANGVSPVFWTAGAALVRPDQASELLRGAITAKMEGSGLLAGVLWRMRGNAETEFLVDWFYSRMPAKGLWEYHVSFLGSVRTLARKDTPELMRALIRHEGFKLADWSQLKEMMEIAGDQRSAPLMDTREIYDAWQRNDGDLKGSLAKWRNLLRREYGLPEEALPPTFLVPKRIVAKPEWVREISDDRATHLTLSPDGNTLAVLTNGTVTIWNATDGTHAWTVPGLRTESALAMTFRRKGNGLLILDRAKYGRFIEWDLESKKPGREAIVKGRPSSGLDRGDYSFDAAGDKLGFNWAAVFCFDTASGKALWSLDGAGTDRLVTLAPDGRLLATEDERAVNLWNAENGRMVRRLEDYTEDVMAIAFSPDSKHLATQTLADGIRIIDLGGDGKTVIEYSYLLHRWGQGSMVFSPDGRRLAVFGTDGGPGKNRVGIFRTDRRELELEIRQQERHTAAATRPMAFSPDGKTLYTFMGRLEAWDLAGEGRAMDP